MIRGNVKHTLIYNEFNSQSKVEWFDYSKNKFIHHLDNVYYSVFLKDDTNKKELIPNNILLLLNDLEERKEKLLLSNDENCVYKDDILLTRHVTKFYNYNLSLKNMFDIFIATSIPNSNTPRIHIQCRAIGLWTLGENELIKKSFDYLIKILGSEIEISYVQENRIDYAYHTNYIQSMREYFNDSCLEINCDTTFEIGSDVFRKQKHKIVKDYLSFGNRKSNNLFWRTYNKSKEVVELNYKSFFIDYWYQSHLISAYDKYLYEKAFKKKSYNEIEFAKLYFYLDYGKNEKIKDEIRILLKNVNTTVVNVRKFIEFYNLCPPATLIINVEWQTMRKFYRTSDKMIAALPKSTICNNYLNRLFQILDNRKIFLEFLSRKNIAFKKDDYECIEENLKNVKLTQSEYDKKIYLDWWYRLRSCKLQSCVDLGLVREYSRKLDIEKIAKRCKGNIATLNLYLGNTETVSINDDLSSFMNYINDNSTYFDEYIDYETGEIKRKDYDYLIVKEKKLRNLKSLLEKASSPTNSEHNK